jgi:flagellar hook protein FlgE
MPFTIALSGLNASSTDLEVIGNNIANSATNGFKGSRAQFADVYSGSIVDSNNAAAGGGVRVSGVAQQFSQGSVDFTSNSLDLAINGEGFFVLEDDGGTQFFTRAGAYSANREGYVVNSAGQRLQVYPAETDASGVTSFTTGVLGDLQLPITASEPLPTSEISAGLNLNATLDPPSNTNWDAAALTADMYNSATSTTIYDSLGNPHTATFYFAKVDPTTAENAWDAHLLVDGQEIALATGNEAAFRLNFNSDGSLAVTDGDPAADGIFDFTIDEATYPGILNGASDMTFSVDFNQSTQFGANFAVNNLTQDGYGSGRLSGVNIDSEGVVFARYTNGRSDAIGKVALAKFNNPQGLQQLGETSWGETFASGTAQFGEAGTSSFGQVQSGALEASNVDIAEQLVNLITAQRNFQANAQVISTADQITQTIINIR